MSGSGTSRIGVAIAAIAVSAGSVITLQSTDSQLTLAVLALAGILLGGALVFQSYETPLSKTIAALLAPPVALLSVLGVVLGFLGGTLSPPSLEEILATVLSLTPIVQFCAGFGVGIAVVGVIGSLRDGIGGAVWGLFRSTFLTTVFVGIAFAVLFIRRQLDPRQQTLGQFDTAPFLSPVFAPASPDIGLFTLGLLVFVLGVAAKTGIAVLPIVAVAGRKHHNRVMTVVDWLRLTSDYLVFVGLLLLGAGILALGTGVVSDLLETQPMLQVLTPLLTGAGIRPLLSWAILGCMLSIVTALVLQLLTGRALNVIQGLLPALCATALLVVSSPIAGTTVQGALSNAPRPAQALLQDQIAVFGPTGIILFGTGGALAVLCGILFVAAVIRFFGWIPSRAVGGAVACAGLILQAIAIAVNNGPSLAIFGVVALAFLVWDVIEYGVTDRAEIDAVSATRSEVIHGLGAGVVGALGIGIAWLVQHGIVTQVSISPQPTTLFALFAALCGVVLALGLVRTEA